LQLLGESAERDANLGESLTAEANGVVTAEAKADFVRAADLDITLVTAQYYLGLAAEQDGDRAEAAKIWRDLIAGAPVGAEWVPEVRNALARVDGSSGVPPAAAEGPIAAAPNAPNEQQSAMIKGMVDASNRMAQMRKAGRDWCVRTEFLTSLTKRSRPWWMRARRSRLIPPSWKRSIGPSSKSKVPACRPMAQILPVAQAWQRKRSRPIMPEQAPKTWSSDLPLD
jgi:hypothetical protein